MFFYAQPRLQIFDKKLQYKKGNIVKYYNIK